MVKVKYLVPLALFSSPNITYPSNKKDLIETFVKNMNVFFVIAAAFFFLWLTKKHTENFSVFSSYILSVSPNTQTPIEWEEQQQQASTAPSSLSPRPRYEFNGKNLLQFSWPALELEVIKHISLKKAFLLFHLNCTWISDWLWFAKELLLPFFCCVNNTTDISFWKV